MCVDLQMIMLVNCHPSSYTVNGMTYYKVCGKVRGYQKTTTDAFDGTRHSGKNIENAYMIVYQ